MTSTVFVPRTGHVCIAMLLAAVLLLTTSPRVQADDAGKLLGAVAAGYLTYQLLDRLDGPGYSLWIGPPPRLQYYPRYDSPHPQVFTYPRYVAPEIDLHRYRFRYPPSQIDPYRGYAAPEIDLHRYRFGYPPSQIDPYRRYYRPPVAPYSPGYGKRTWGW